ncbi:MAG: toxin-antitoxin system HicB family antitoxin [Chloroflexota bacterium]|nr:toxin-antitoxin system HicB family antitoxin [Chloroflexota bacterium]MDE2684079.1 toxin-antitoxin system HicB family antitoxin [Chloroflexota bacterium]
MGDAEYEVVVVYDEENAEFFGSVTGRRDGFTFIGSTPAEVKKEFRISFDDYVKFCVERGRGPDESITGAREAQVVADVHRAADAAAGPDGMTLNEWLDELDAEEMQKSAQTA